MKIVLASPLYPPDTAPLALYIKELAVRLREDHEVTIVTYGQIPEVVRDVRIVAVSKQQPLLYRLLCYTFVLWREARSADILYAQNGASVELPVGLVSLIARTPIVIHIGDEAAHNHAGRSRIFGSIERFAFSRANEILEDSPLRRPEILPLQERPIKEFARYEASWLSHLSALTHTFHAIRR